MNVAALVVAGVMAMVGTASEPGVTGTGTSTVRVMPDTMTVTVDLVGTDEQFDKALAAIQQQGDDVKKALQGLKLPPAKVTVDGPTRGPTPGSEREAMMRRRVMQAMGRSAPAQPEDNKVTLGMSVSADWKLTATDAVALLEETDAIEKAVRAALPKPAEKQSQLTEEQEEEMLSLMGRAEEQRPPGVPVFSFSATLPADMLLKARKEAFQRAAADAKSLADAAGGALGGLANLSGSVSQSDMEAVYSGYYYGYPSRYLRSTQEAQPLAVSDEPRELAFSVRIQAEFGLRAK